MRRFKNILVIYNPRTDNKIAFKQAAWIAESNNAELSLVEVIEDELPYYLKETVIKDRLENLQECFAASVEKERKVNCSILLGTPFAEVIKEVIRRGHDLVIMEPQKPIGMMTRIFCSLAIHLIRKCPCPVWIMRPKKLTDRGFKILAAIDARPAQPVDFMNQKIMKISTSMAKMFKCELHIIHAWNAPWEQVLKIHPELSKDDKSTAIKNVRVRRKEYMVKLLKKYPLEEINHQWHLHKGRPDDVISNYIAMEQINLLVMGTVCKSGLVGIIVGNTCDDILQQVNCSVMGLKPEGFVSPIVL
ncbi:MAG: universal stress protein [bacterium]|nr:universal stress protein [bacterium]